MATFWSAVKYLRLVVIKSPLSGNHIQPAQLRISNSDWFKTIFARKKDLRQAITEYDLAIKADSKNGFAFFNRGLIHYELKEYDQAIKDFDQMIGLDFGDFSMVYHSRGRAWAAKGDDNRAIADYNKAIEIQPNYGMAYYHRSVAERRLGRSLQADSDRETARRHGVSQDK